MFHKPDTSLHEADGNKEDAHKILKVKHTCVVDVDLWPEGVKEARVYRGRRRCFGKRAWKSRKDL
jgi:hypothetical protein